MNSIRLKLRTCISIGLFIIGGKLGPKQFETMADPVYEV